MYEDEDNDGRFPTSPLPPQQTGGAERPRAVAVAAWNDCREQCGPEEWYVCVEVREMAVLRDGRRAPRGTASRNLYYPCCFRDGSEIRPRTASSGAASATRPGAGGNRDWARRPSPIPSARWLRTFGSFRVGRAVATMMV